MFLFVKNYKKSFLSHIKNSFSETVGWVNSSELKNEDFNWDALSDLKALKKAVSDGKITTEEAVVITENISQIEWEAKQGLNEIINKVLLQEWFSAMNKTSYDSFKILVEKSENNFKIPSWDDIIQKVIDNSNYWSWISLNKNDPLIAHLDKDAFHWITIKGDSVEVKYDSWWEDDTLEMKFNQEGVITSSDWKRGINEEVDVSWETKIDLTSMDDNIREVEQKEIDRKQNEKIDKNEADIKDLWENTEKALKDVKVILGEHAKKIEKNWADVKDLWENTEKALKDVKIILDEYAKKIEKNWADVKDLWENTEKALKDVKIILDEYAKKIEKNWADVKDLWKNTRDAFKVVKVILDEHAKGIEANSLDNSTVKEEVKEELKKEIKKEPVEVELLAGYEREYSKANDWYALHGWVTDSVQIIEIKKVLKDEWSIISSIDGEFNKEFFNAVINYQSDNNLVKDGLVWRKTMDEMMMDYKGDFVDTREKAKKYYGV